MQSFHLTEEEYANLNRINLLPGIINSESNLYRFPEKIEGKDAVFKDFFVNGDDYFYNKMDKANIIAESGMTNPIDNLVYPNVYVNGTLRGITLPYIIGHNLKRFLDNPNVSFQQKFSI